MRLARAVQRTPKQRVKHSQKGGFDEKCRYGDFVWILRYLLQPGGDEPVDRR